MVKTNQHKIVGHCDTFPRIRQRSNYSNFAGQLNSYRRYLNEIKIDFCKSKKIMHLKIDVNIVKNHRNCHPFNNIVFINFI